MNNFIHAEIEVDGCDVQCRVNDIPVWSVLHRRSSFHAMPIHEFLVQGVNSIRLVRLDQPVAQLPQDDDAGEASPPATAQVRVAAYPPDAPLGQGGGQQLALLSYGSRDAAGNSLRVADLQFDLPRWPFVWSWASLPAQDWYTPQMRRRVFDWLQEFAGRFRRADHAWLAAVLRPKMAEYCQAYGLDLAAEMKELQARMARRAADSEFRMTPFSESDLALHACAGGRLVDCVVAGGEPAIRWVDSRTGPSGGAMRLKLGHDGLQLIVLR